jgi:hypothetical protein
MVEKYNQKLFFFEETLKERQLHKRTMLHKSGSINPQTGQYCHGIVFQDCTLSFVCLIWHRFMAP